MCNVKLMEKQSAPAKLSLAIIAILTWFAVIAQFCININSGAESYSLLILRFFDYFTITTNITVAVTCTIIFLKQGNGWGKFFSKQQTLTAVTVYILVVGLIYNLILRVLWKPEGLQMIVNELLHSVIPVLFLLYWLVFAPKDQLKWKNAWSWLLYPLVYTIYVFIFGAITGFYPYPFVDLTQLGPGKTLINVAGVAILFLAFSYLLIAIAKFLSRKNA